MTIIIYSASHSSLILSPSLVSLIEGQLCTESLCCMTLGAFHMLFLLPEHSFALQYVLSR